MSKEENIKDIIEYINEDVSNKKFLTYDEMGGWEQYLTNIIDNIVEKENQQLQQENNYLKERVEYLERSNDRREDEILSLRQELVDKDDKIDKAIEKLTFLIDIGFDYDGFNKIESLKTLIDELVSYARESRKILKGE